VRRGTCQRGGVTRSDREVALDYLRWLDEAPRSRRDRRRAEAPVSSLQATALSDPDPYRRARCLAVLDHVANEASTEVFAAALRDPVNDVRRQAVHGLTCERCRSGEVCVGDVVPAVVAALAAEDDTQVRHQLVVTLGRFATRSDLARQTLQTVGAQDADELLRVAASAVLATGHTRGRKSLERLARRARRS
jgi:HEAT repeat protein